MFSDRVLDTMLITLQSEIISPISTDNNMLTKELAQQKSYMLTEALQSVIVAQQQNIKDKTIITQLYFLLNRIELYSRAAVAIDTFIAATGWTGFICGFLQLGNFVEAIQKFNEDYCNPVLQIDSEKETIFLSTNSGTALCDLHSANAETLSLDTVKKIISVTHSDVISRIEGFIIKNIQEISDIEQEMSRSTSL